MAEGSFPPDPKATLTSGLSCLRRQLNPAGLPVATSVQQIALGITWHSLNFLLKEKIIGVVRRYLGLCRIPVCESNKSLEDSDLGVEVGFFIIVLAVHLWTGLCCLSDSTDLLLLSKYANIHFLTCTIRK